MQKYKTILADPPWPLEWGYRKRRPNSQKRAMPYPTMTLDEIQKLPIRGLADDNCHLWLWTTNTHLKNGFEVMEAWGFKYLAPIIRVKPSGCGNWFVHVTQTLLMGYRGRLNFPAGAKYKKNLIFTTCPKRHSQKPSISFDFIESISSEPRIELFARNRRFGWDAWGNEVDSDIDLSVKGGRNG